MAYPEGPRQNFLAAIADRQTGTIDVRPLLPPSYPQLPDSESSQRHQVEQMVEEAHDAIKRTFGKAEKVPVPSTREMHIFGRVAELGGSDIALRYYPAVDLRNPNKFPSGYVAPHWSIVHRVTNGVLPDNLLQVKAGWRIVDERKKPQPHLNTAYGTYANDKDFMGKLVQDRDNQRVAFRDFERGRILYLAPDNASSRKDKVAPSDSRFGLAANEIQGYIVPAFARLIPVATHKSEMPSIAENNVHANLYGREGIETDTAEWTRDVVEMEQSGKHGSLIVMQFIDGSRWKGGLQHQELEDPRVRRSDVGFRLQINLQQSA